MTGQSVSQQFPVGGDRSWRRLCGLDGTGELLATAGAAPSDEAGLPLPLCASAHTLFGPRGACLAGLDGPLWVADTGHHRLLGWARLPDGTAAADWVIGQRDFGGEARNGGDEADAASLHMPVGLCRLGEGLAVADAWNHRVLLWHRVPAASHVPADRVLGQADFRSVEPNRGAALPRADTLFWPFGVHWDGERLFVADTGNRRVLIWDGLPGSDGAPATGLLGQGGFDRRDENGGRDPNGRGMVWPHAVTRWGDRLCVADAGNNRIMIWPALPACVNAPAEAVLGQDSWGEVSHNRGGYRVGAATLSMPYGLVAAGEWLLVADTANSRLLGWHTEGVCDGAAAQWVHGQEGFERGGDNRWRTPAADSLCWPYALDCCGDRLVIADTGNNRVQVWQSAI